MTDLWKVERLPVCKVDCRQMCQLSAWGVCDRHMYDEFTPDELAAYKAVCERVASRGDVHPSLTAARPWWAFWRKKEAQ